MYDNVNNWLKLFEFINKILYIMNYYEIMYF